MMVQPYVALSLVSQHTGQSAPSITPFVISSMLVLPILLACLVTSWLPSMILKT